MRGLVGGVSRVGRGALWLGSKVTVLEPAMEMHQSLRGCGVHKMFVIFSKSVRKAGGGPTIPPAIRMGLHEPAPLGQESTPRYPCHVGMGVQKASAGTLGAEYLFLPSVPCRHCVPCVGL